MFGNLFDSNDKQIKKLRPIVDQINSLEEETAKLTEAQFKEKTQFWKDELQDLDDTAQQKYLDKILPEAFALVREALKRTMNGHRHFDVQLMGGIVLHQGKISEQKTGEGKTYTASLALYLNALTQNGVHLITPNDYLSRHGAGWLGPLYTYLGMTVGVIMQAKAFIYDSEYESSEFKDDYAKRLKEVPRQQAYQVDITYGTNHEFGFDYLRDNMSAQLGAMVQTNLNNNFGVHNFAVVDEVDSILIDFARTPLIIAGRPEKATERYQKAKDIVAQLTKDTDYEVDDKFRQVTLTDFGVRRVEKLLGAKNLYEDDFEMVHLLEQSLTARALYEKDKEYIVKDGQVIIVDQNTGRLLPSNRFSQGLHQAIEAKENVEIGEESKTVAEISYQNYFRMYKKLAGMTGTAVTEAEEFHKIYGLDVVVLPTNKPISRSDHNDVVYKTEAGKFRAVANEIQERHEKGQPVLVGTTTVEKSELLHSLLKRRKVPHQILNAKNHESEALIIAQAGSRGAVTISTNMAGRGVDIILGGDPVDSKEQQVVKDAGGLHVIGTERHDSRRIDNQLRGRSGRQGDVGSSRFFVSLQDNLMKIFGGEQVEKIMNRLGIDDNMPLEAKLVSKSIENAQKKVEGFNFDRRKQLVEMDDVMNVHREVVYKLRRRILDLSGADLEHKVWLRNKLGIDDAWDKFEKQLGERDWLGVLVQLSLPVVDMLWMEHLSDMSHVRDGIGLRGYAQKDPVVEYKREGHERFEKLVGQVYVNIAERLSRLGEVRVRSAEEVALEQQQHGVLQNVSYQQGTLESGVSEEGRLLQNLAEGSGVGTGVSGRRVQVQAVKSGQKKVGRNDPCPCGSGKKYKKCGMIGASEHKV